MFLKQFGTPGTIGRSFRGDVLEEQQGLSVLTFCSGRNNPPLER